MLRVLLILATLSGAISSQCVRHPAGVSSVGPCVGVNTLNRDPVPFLTLTRAFDGGVLGVSWNPMISGSGQAITYVAISLRWGGPCEWQVPPDTLVTGLARFGRGCASTVVGVFPPLPGGIRFYLQGGGYDLIRMGYWISPPVQVVTQ